MSDIKQAFSGPPQNFWTGFACVVDYGSGCKVITGECTVFKDGNVRRDAIHLPYNQANFDCNNVISSLYAELGIVFQYVPFSHPVASHTICGWFRTFGYIR